MTPRDQKDFSAMLTSALAFWRTPVSDFTLDAWWGACQPFGLDDVRRALETHAVDPDRGHFSPMPADIVRTLRGTVGDRALLAWTKVLGAISSVGAYQSVAFDDPVIHAALEDVGGWVAICQSKTDELSHWQRRFADSYRALSRSPGLKYAPRLAGVHEIELAGTKWQESTPEPTLIGDPTKAREVLQQGAGHARVRITAPVRLADALPLPALPRPVAPPPPPTAPPILPARIGGVQ